MLKSGNNIMLIEIQNLNVAYGRKKVLENVTLTLSKNEITDQEKRPFSKLLSVPYLLNQAVW